MTGTGVFFTSRSDNWNTPQDLFDFYDRIYHFTLDAASSDENAKTAKHYTARDSGLEHSWGGGDRMAESSLRKGDIQMAEKGLRRRAEGKHCRRLLAACENRYSLVSRLLYEGKHRVFEGKNKILRAQKQCSVRIHDRYV